MMLKATVRGREYDVEVNNAGTFITVDANGNRCQAPSMPELKAKLGKVSLRVSVPYTKIHTSWRETTVTDGEFTGRHADGNRLLAREGGKAVQYGRYDREFLRRLTPGQREDLLARIEAKRVADERLNWFIADYKITEPWRLIDDAIEEAHKAREVNNGTDQEDG